MTATVSAQKYDDAVAEIAALQARLETSEQQRLAAQRQLDWFKRQLFGSRSEKRLEIDPALQPGLFAGLIEDAPPAPPTETVEVQRRKKSRDGAVNDSGLQFDETVLVRVIEVAPRTIWPTARSSRPLVPSAWPSGAPVMKCWNTAAR
ncbi:transposase IS66 family protein [Salinisphaera hydrothermalis EPR70]